ncbi:diguanylate cyclase AdrA [Escherichia coli]|uniref:diguanylate cyclase AdrA n=1 Tax=Escherichia coli TaxID=562 RepID=UPI000BE8B221|nr:diguanylate cyclase AdrA [Escherichia coli]EEZ8960332.1 diguanylate cyclase AdrA [Escherichia coli]EFH9422703.1 diguanylate cyclase AdrA [Escherichia coli]EGF1495841.1 diguanylate cyclase AdrA [Escherichia coli]EGI1188852.1 diguanylate cyclase AdrA [Escherichia coli]EJG5007391.1 diguanylate cyclase AdrA [Escherichia coli]
MFPKIMNDENFFKKAAAHGEEPPLTPQNEHQRSGLRFARRVRLPRAVGLAGMFLPIASTLVSHPSPGWWWLLLVGWAFVWPHLAWQIASRAVDPLSREIYNLKTDAVLAGMWVGVMGVNAPPSTAMLMIMCLNLMGAGGPRLFVAGLVLMVVSCLVTLELTGITVSFNSAPLEWWLSLPIIVIYPLLFGWVSYQTATKLAEHKRRLQVMSTRDGMTGVYNRRHWETMLRNEFDNCRRHNRDATLLIIDIDHFKSINDTWGHDVGDEAIVALTRQLQITLRGSDVIGRFGGDEFAVIMSGTPAESAITAMLRVHEGLNTLRLPNTPQVTLRISVGVAPLNPQMSHYREWLKSADLALYKAKKAGRNRTEVAA